MVSRAETELLKQYRNKLIEEMLKIEINKDIQLLLGFLSKHKGVCSVSVEKVNSSFTPVRIKTFNKKGTLVAAIEVTFSGKVELTIQ